MDTEQITLPIGQQVSLPGHFDVPVVLEVARPLGKGFECRVRLPDGTLDEAVLSAEEAAKALGVGRQALSSLLNEKAALTSHMALRVEKAFGPKMDHLMRMQLAYDLA